LHLPAFKLHFFKYLHAAEERKTLWDIIAT